MFPGSEPEKPDLSSLVMDSTIPQELRERILLEVESCHKANGERNKAMDAKFRALYSSATGAINDFSEVVRGYGKVVTALDLRSQNIIWRSGPFIKATSVVTLAKPKSKPKQLKPGAKPVPSAAVSMASQAKKKSRSRGKGRSTHGQASHPLPPPHQPTPKPATATAPAQVDQVQFPSMDIRVKQGQLQDNRVQVDLR